jgi:WD40 repeat protein
VLYILDVRKRETIRRLDLPLEQVLSPTWSPDGRQLVMTGNVGGLTDLYLVNADGTGLRQLTKDRFGDMQPSWSPDGKTIAFASDRDTDFEVLRLARWKISLLDLATGQVTEVPDQDGLNINPQWAPDGRSIAFVSDRTGTANLFLYDLDAKEHFQLTNVVGAVNSQTEFSPAISWAHKADVLAFVYYEKGTNNVWSIRNPRLLRRQPFRATAPAATIAGGAPGTPGAPAAAGTPGTPTVSPTVQPPLPGGTVAAGAPAPGAPAIDTTPASRSLYRTPAATFRASAALAGGTARPGAAALSVTALLDSAALALPDTARFKDTRYRAGFQPEYIAQPQVGYGQNNFGQGVFGGTTIVLGDLLGNQQLAISGAVNGQISDAMIFSSYTNLARRLQYTTGISQMPLYFLGSAPDIQEVPGGFIVTDNLQRFVQRDAFWRALYPFDRFTRLEAGARLSNISQSIVPIETFYNQAGIPIQQRRGGSRGGTGATMVAPSFAFVRDNALFGYTSPIMGQRLRLEVEPQIGGWQWVNYTVDYRRYDPILFNFLTIATRFTSAITAGRDEGLYPKYIGRPDFIRGYNREPYVEGCGAPGTTQLNCGALQLFGSRVAFANAEVRFPLIRRFDLGVLPIALPPIDALVFYDAGIAWTGQAPRDRPDIQTQKPSLTRPDNYDLRTQRFPLRSYGYGIRFNLFGFAILRWDYAWPVDTPGAKPFGTWFFGPSF